METQSRCSILEKLSRAKDQGLQLWQTKSFAIITHATVTGDCIDRVISQNGDRLIFERLATPRPAPKITLKSNWLALQPQLQQLQQPTLEEDVHSIWKQHAARVRDDMKNATEVEIASRNLVRAVSKVDVGTHLNEQEVITDAFSITKRILKKSNEWKLDRTKFAFAKTKLTKRLCSAKNPALPFSNWTMWSSSAYTTYLKEHSSANAAS